MSLSCDRFTQEGTCYMNLIKLVGAIQPAYCVFCVTHLKLTSLFRWLYPVPKHHTKFKCEVYTFLTLVLGECE